MSEIKVRVWDKEMKQMIYQGDDDYSFILEENGLKVYDKNMRIQIDHEAMLSTGLTDKNGREIYEGDIVLADSEYGEKVRDIVCWSYGSFYVANHTFKKLNHIEVIGNIYQHKHLLKENEL